MQKKKRKTNAVGFESKLVCLAYFQKCKIQFSKTLLSNRQHSSEIIVFQFVSLRNEVRFNTKPKVDIFSYV